MIGTSNSPRWARLALLVAEKEFTRERDALTRRRMGMPWERVDKPYGFEGPDGTLSLADLFDGRSQLIVYHFMFGADWEEGCKSCSFSADNFDGIPVHLNHRDVTFAVVSRAPFARIDAYRRRMGWSFPWVIVTWNTAAASTWSKGPTISSISCRRGATRTVFASRCNGCAATISIERPRPIEITNPAGAVVRVPSR